MTSFPLKIVTSDGILFDGLSEKVVARTMTGDVGILAGHMDFITCLSRGSVMVTSRGKTIQGLCGGGFLHVFHGSVTLVCASFAWNDESE